MLGVLLTQGTLHQKSIQSSLNQPPMPSPQLIQNPLTPYTFQGSVNGTNPTSDFQIDLTKFSASAANISLMNVSGDADLQVFRESTTTGGTRTLIQQSKNVGSLPESILLDPATLTPGIYTIEVTLGSTTTSANYSLNVAVNANANVSNLLWRNAAGAQAGVWQMNGTTVAATTPYGSIPAEWKVQAISDLNGDGEDDVLWRNMNTGQVGYWLFKGGQRTETGVSLATPTPLDWQIAAVKDLNGDGQADVVWYNAQAQQAGIWMLSGGKFLTAAGYNVGTWKPIASADLNGDTKNDIVFQNSLTGEVGFWQMNGTTITQSAGVKAGITWQPQFYGDLNGDGQDDIVWRDSASGAVGFWLMNGVKSTATWGTGAVSSDWQIVGLGNFDGNPSGDKELLWSNSKTGDLGIWTLNSTGTAITSRSSITLNGQNYNKGTGWTIAGIGDFNNDGKDDILYRNAQQGSTQLLVMNGASIASTQDLGTVDPSWQIQGIMKRQITATPFNISGRTVTGGFDQTTAFDLGQMNGSGKYTDNVQPGFSDYFKFSVSTPSNVTLGITQPQGQTGVNLQLFQIQSDGTLSSTAITPSPEMLLAIGSYAVKISTATNSTLSYTFNAFGKPQATDVAGAKFTATPSFVLNPTGTKNVVTATFQIVNNGSTTLNSVDVDFLLSRDGQIDPTSATDAVLKLDSSMNSSSPTIYTLATPLAPGATSAPISVQLDLPDTSSSFWYVDGNYTIGMAVNPNGKLLETNTTTPTNNYNVALGTDKSTLAITGTQTVQVVGSSMQKASGTFAAGNTVNVSLTLQNIGNKALSDGQVLPVRFYLSSDTTLDKTADYALGIGQVSSPAWSMSDDAGGATEYSILPTSQALPVLGAAGSSNSQTTASDTLPLTFTLTLPSSYSSSQWNNAQWQSGTGTFYLVSYVDTPNEADPTKETIDPTLVGTSADTLNKNYLKLTL